MDERDDAIHTIRAVLNQLLELLQQLEKPQKDQSAGIAPVLFLVGRRVNKNAENEE